MRIEGGGNVGKAENNLTFDFITTLFIGKQMVSRMLSDILKNRNNRLFLDMLGVPSDFIVPFIQREEGISVSYYFENVIGHMYEVILNGQVCYDERVIQSGDYFVFRRFDNSNTVKILFVASQDVQIGYKKYQLQKNMNIFIGRHPLNDITYGFSDFISREKHAAIHIDDIGRAFIEDLKRSVGVYVNGMLAHSKELKLFDEIFIMGLSMIYMGDFIAVRNLKIESTLISATSFPAKTKIYDNEKKDYFTSTPRILKSLDQDVIEIDSPPNPFTTDDTPMILTLGPSLTMSVVMMASLGISIANAISGGELSTIIASGMMAAGMLLGSLLWPSLLRNYQKRKILAAEDHRQKRYASYIMDIEEKIKVKKDRTIRLLNDSLCPSPEILCAMCDNEINRLRLWERSHMDDDFLDLRLGLGRRPFDVQLKIPRQGFQLYEDKLRNLPGELSQKYRVLENVPLTIDLCNNRMIGLIGNTKNMLTILNEMILNIISLHPYDEVKLVLVSSEKQKKEFDVFKNVPHIWSNDKRVRFFATNSDEVHYVFSYLDENIKERIQTAVKDKVPVPYYVIIITEAGLIEREALQRYMCDPENKVGITTVFAYGDISKLPKACNTIIQSDSTRTGYYIKNKNENKFIQFIPDKIDVGKICSFANKLSSLPVKRDVRSMGIADQISFLQMYKVGNVNELDIESHWVNNNSDRSLAAPIGVMAGGEVFYLDIHEAYHGCHGLVAGTTGSGKSEFLQSFILSLAINYSPKEVAFVLVDFKGGDMARPFMEKPFSPALPHLSATISNLSGNILYRALVSLDAEIKSRQRIFNEAALSLGVDKLDINSYHKYYKSGRLKMPLPHLIIIIDEFAQLKMQHYEFLEQLINVAQVGRSLGIHLILATQKPSGIVDPQIMSNSRFKVCLKVADKQDSVDMINKPDAAMIKNPGRLYLQVGYDEINEYIQSGYSGAEYTPTSKYISDEEITVQMTDNTAKSIYSAKIDLGSSRTDKTQLEAVVSEIVSLGQKKNIVAKPLWLDVLPEKILLSKLKKERKGLCSVTIGLLDYVRIQEQEPLTIDFTKTGHIGLYGASGTGKTTFLQTLVCSLVWEYKYTPEEINLYALDFGGRNLGYLSDLPHTGGIVFADDENKLSELSAVLYGIIEERKQIFADNNCSTFVEYHAIGKKLLPAIIVLIDNFASFRDKYVEISEKFTEIISEGKTFGVYFVITGSTRDSIYYKVTEHIATYFTLKMNDFNNYLDIHGVRPPVIPEDINGRGITVIDREVIEFQIAIAFDSETESERLAYIKQKYSELAREWKGYLPIRLDDSFSESMGDMDETFSNQYSKTRQKDLPESICEESRNVILGTSKSGALLYGITLSEDYRICICAKEGNDLKKYYKKFLEPSMQYSDRQLYFIDSEDGGFQNLVDGQPSCTYICDRDAFDKMIEELRPELNSRLEKPEEYHKELIIVVAEFNEFFNMISDEQAAFMRKVFQYINDPKYRICFICGFDVNGDKNNDRLFMSLVVHAENYIICPECYEKASEKIEMFPFINNVKNQSCYLCLKEKNVEIRW